MLKANETIQLLTQDVQIEHEEGFNKALRQAAYPLGANPITASFDIAQDVFNGEMRSIPMPDGAVEQQPDGEEEEEAADDDGTEENRDDDEGNADQ